MPSPCTDGQRHDADVDRVAADVETDVRPSCGRRRSAMSRSPMIFRRETTPGDHAARDRGGLVQHAVDAEAHAHVLAVRLEVDVRGALLDGLRR